MPHADESVADASLLARDQLTRVVDAANQLDVLYTYDGHGNRTGREVKRGEPPQTISQVTYTFDSRDRLIKAEPNAPNTGDTPTLAFIYDADDHKIARIETPWLNGVPQTAQAKITYELREGINLLHEAIPGNAASTTPNAQGLRITDSYRRGAKLDRHVRFDDSGSGGGSSNPQAQVRFYQLDALDTPVVISDTTGSAVASNTLDAWGNTQQQTANGQSNAPQSSANANVNPLLSAQANLLSNDNQNIGFTGYQKDPVLGLYYANARWYDPLIGGFNARDPAMGDPAKPVTYNKYLYANANPIMYVDPDGRVGFLTTLRNQFDDADAYFRLLAEQNPRLAQHIGVMRGTVSLVGGGVRGVNLASDGVASLLDESYYGEVATEGRRELAATLDPVFAYAERYANNPLSTAWDTNLRVLSGVANKARGIASNDGGDISDAYALLTEFAVPAVAARAGLVSAVEEATATARVIDDVVPDTSAATRAEVVKEGVDGNLLLASDLDREMMQSVDRALIERQQEIISRQAASAQNSTEASGIRFAYGEMRKRGYLLEDVDLRYRGEQGIDQVYSQMDVDRFAIVENKSARGTGALATDAGGLRQGSLSYNIDRLQKYIKFGDGAFEEEAQFLLQAARRGDVESMATFLRSKRVLEFPPGWPTSGSPKKR